MARGGSLKTTLSIFALFFLASTSNAQTIQILNPKIGPGDVTIIRIAPQWQGPLVCVSAFGNDYRPNGSGYVFIGIDVETGPAKYPVFLVECGRNVRLDWNYIEIEVTEKKFPVIKINRKLTPVNPARRMKESQKIAEAYARSNGVVDHRSGDFIMPLDNLSIPADITDEFGKKRIYLNGETRHGGIDLRAMSGSSVKAINSGVVLLAAQNFSLEGNLVIIDHGSGIISLYLHLSRVEVKEGDKIRKGSVVGLSGATGSVTGPHLHLIIKVKGTNVDPLRFIDTLNKYLKP